MPYSNQYLTEVVCGFNFIHNAIPWDSTYFGQYYEKIREHGFTEKQERKGFQIEITTNPFQSVASAGAQTLNDQMIFKNPDSGWAIVMAKGQISFHIVKDYTNWQDFRNNFIAPFADLYKQIGLDAGIRNCHIVYLNRLVKDVSEDLSEYFTIISPLHGKFGSENNTILQRTFNNQGKNEVFTRLIGQVHGDKRQINFECGAICINQECMKNPDWVKQADETHEPIRSFFEEIITDKLRQEL